jgi:Zn-dependent protease
VSSGIRLGRFAGVEVAAEASAFLLSLFFGVAVFVRLRQSVPGVSNELAAIFAVGAGIAVLGCVFVHEAGHVIVARRRRLSVRSVRLFMFGGHSVIDGDPSPRTEFLVSGAGPLASVVLGLLLFVASYAFGDSTLAGATLWALALASVAIGGFNLLPGFPLDGGRIVRSVLVMGGRNRAKATRDVTTVGRVLGAVVMAFGIYLLVRTQMSGLFWLAVGWFLVAAAASAGRREELSVTFDGVTVFDAMRPTLFAISGDAIISDVIDRFGAGSRLPAIPVQVSNRVVGILGSDEIDSVAPSRWQTMRAGALMTRIGPADIVEANAPLESLFIDRADSTRPVVVVSEGTVVGVVDERSLESMRGHG